MQLQFHFRLVREPSTEPRLYVYVFVRCSHSGLPCPRDILARPNLCYPEIVDQNVSLGQCQHERLERQTNEFGIAPHIEQRPIVAHFPLKDSVVRENVMSQQREYRPRPCVRLVSYAPRSLSKPRPESPLPPHLEGFVWVRVDHKASEVELPGRRVL
jgi:hypothetical protein